MIYVHACLYVLVVAYSQHVCHVFLPQGGSEELHLWSIAEAVIKQTHIPPPPCSEAFHHGGWLSAH